jgi:hypothetical protein
VPSKGAYFACGANCGFNLTTPTEVDRLKALIDAFGTGGGVSSVGRDAGYLVTRKAAV